MSATIPCLSLWQPWATLMAIGAKRIETRSWGTNYRGPLAIHAASRWGADILRIAAHCPFYEAMRRGGVEYSDIDEPVLPLGKIIAVVDLVDVVRIGAAFTAGANEYAFGDYTTGRFAWITNNHRALPEPVAWRGCQRLFKIPASVVGVDVEIPS